MMMMMMMMTMMMTMLKYDKSTLVTKKPVEKSQSRKNTRICKFKVLYQHNNLGLHATWKTQIGKLIVLRRTLMVLHLLATTAKIPMTSLWVSDPTLYALSIKQLIIIYWHQTHRSWSIQEHT